MVVKRGTWSAGSSSACNSGPYQLLTIGPIDIIC